MTKEIKEEVVWGYKNREDAMIVAENFLCREGHEVIVQNIANGYSSEVVVYLVVERKIEE